MPSSNDKYGDDYWRHCDERRRTKSQSHTKSRSRRTKSPSRYSRSPSHHKRSKTHRTKSPRRTRRTNSPSYDYRKGVEQKLNKRISKSRSRSQSTEHYKQRHESSRSHSRGFSSHYKSSQYRDRKSYTPSHSRSRSSSLSNSRSHHKHSRSRQRSSLSRSPKTSDKRYRSRSLSSDRLRKLSEEKDHDHDRTPEACITYNHNDEKNRSIQYNNHSSNFDEENLKNLPLPEQTESNSYDYNYDDSQEPFDKERIHREMEEKLRQALAKEGKIYPPPKPEASHPVFANDGSFLEIFKKMQEAQQAAASTSSSALIQSTHAITSTSTTIYAAATTSATINKVNAPPITGRRRGVKILKTGVVAKTKGNGNGSDNNDFWSLYLAEVNKYKNNACELNLGNRPLQQTISMSKKKDKRQEEEMKLETAPFDPRFPNQNQTRYCYQSYVDFYRCQKIRGEQYEPCNYFKKVFTSICPNAWVEKWNDQRDSGTFPGRI